MFGLKTSTSLEDEEHFLVFDAVTAYSRSLTGEISKHPIATGTNAASHFIAQNPVFSLTAVISFADLGNASLFRDEDNGLADNLIEQPQAVIVKDSTSVLANIIPSSISQFLPDSNASVSMDSARTNYKDFVSLIFERLMSGEKYDEKTGKTKASLRTNTLYEFDHLGAITKLHEDLVLTSFSVKEDIDTGDCLIADLTFEHVKFVKLRTSAIPADVASALKKKSTAKQNKGSVNSKPVTKELDEQDDLYNVLKPKNQTTTEFYNQ